MTTAYNPTTVLPRSQENHNKYTEAQNKVKVKSKVKIITERPSNVTVGVLLGGLALW